MDTALAEAFIHRTHTVCGFELRALTLRHAFVLEALENPFAPGSEDQPVSLEELYQAARICSTGNESELLAVLSAPPLLPADFAPWVEQEYVEYLSFKAFAKDHASLPRLLRSASPASWQNHPYLILASRLMRHGSMGYEAAWWMPLGAAYWHALALAEIGDAKFHLVTDQDRADWQRLGYENI